MRILSLTALLLLLSVLAACSDDDAGLPAAWYTDVIPDAIMVEGGGLQAAPAPAESVYYFNSLHTAAESDVRMDDSVKGIQTARRYLYVSGTAVPDDSGYTDRYYTSVNFIVVSPTDRYYSFSLPVDSRNRFSGWLYFPETGEHTVYALRARNATLYPGVRGTLYTVAEGNLTLGFYVNASEAVPAAYTNILPTAQVNSGNAMIRDQAARISAAAGAVTDRQKVIAVYNFLIDGDDSGKFIYEYYDQLYPGFLSLSYNSAFIASHFLYLRKGVCNDFAELFAALVRSQGIPVKKESGYDTSSGGHMWNRVYFDGQWWWLDATWANNVPNSRNAFAEWTATAPQKTDFIQDHYDTYTVEYSSVF